MSFMQDSELSIFHAEAYDDGMSGFRAPRSLPSDRPQAGTGGKARKAKKRSNAQSLDAGELEGEETKKYRGRSRLDTNDETAKDRRRTQIRLAQRAYRNRKETAIQSLGKKVDELRRANEEMSKEFMKLYDFVIRKGIHKTTPEIGLQLQAATKKFVSLARRTSEEPDGDGELPASQENECEVEEASPTRECEKHNKSRTPDAVKPMEAMYGSFTTSHDKASLRSAPRFQTLNAVNTTSSAADSRSHAPHPTPAQAPLGYEIVTEPMPDNAGFPFGISFEQSVVPPDSLSLSNQPSSGPLFSILSAPLNYAPQERTFGRRLQQSMLEKAYLLVCMPDPLPDLSSSALSFCLISESKEHIIQRMASCLSASHRETMCDRKFPFVQMNKINVAESLGADKPRNPVDNQGTDEPHGQKGDSLFGIGPWDNEMEEMRDLKLDWNTGKLHMSVSGFDDGFYDSDEVEWVLQQRGVVIPPAVDFVTAEIDPADFSTDTIPRDRTLSISTHSHVADITSALSSAGTTPREPVVREWYSVNSMATRPPYVYCGDPQSVGQLSEAPLAQTTFDPNLRSDSFGLGNESPSEPSGAGATSKRLVTINVAVLIQEIGLKSVFLGRAPCVQPRDLNIAFWASLTP